MMVYEYHCEKCAKSTDIIKSVSEYNKDEPCSSCSSLMTRVFNPGRITLYNTKVQDAYFSHAFGQVVKGDSHARTLAKDKGWIEVGNENPIDHVKPKVSNYDLD